jgi:uncharacterized membrane protein
MVPIGDDVEIWLLFAPFWILGIGALVGAVWHFVHLAIATRRAQAGKRDHHFRRFWLFVAGMVGAPALGMAAALIWAVAKG